MVIAFPEPIQSTAPRVVVWERPGVPPDYAG
ncbi:hypothetical protein BDI4_660073 [Burkholderia diffusa]|nr:hypothetical protein BDI4_660073 [Burkholderia diffusa]